MNREKLATRLLPGTKPNFLDLCQFRAAVVLQSLRSDEMIA
jgi:hypothetical protein